MTLTQRTIPDAIHSAFNPVIYEVSTNRTTAASKTVASIANSSGKLKITTTTAHQMTTGDMVIVSGISGLASLTRTAITVADVDEFVCTNINWDAAFVNTGGNVSKDNRNVIVRAQVYSNSALVATHYTRSETNNGSHDVYRFDLSGVLGDLIDNNAGNGTDRLESSLIYSHDPSYSSALYYVKFAELFDDVEGLQVMGNELTMESRRAVNIAMQTGEAITDYLCTASAAGRVLTPHTSIYLKAGQTVSFQCLTSETSVGLKLTPYTTLSGAGTPTYGTKITVKNNKLQCTFGFDLFDTGQTRYDIAFYTGTSTVISNTISIYPRSGSSRLVGRIQYRNLSGGVDTIYPTDYESLSDNESKSLMTSTGEVVVWGVVNDRAIQMTIAGSPEQLAAYEQLLTSRFIWFNGSRCELVNRSQTTQSREYQTWTLKFKIKGLMLN